ncbi:hypothetical protein LENED_004514 [Lentinula edodes]|uniref:Uncharacterized protein n=1 Tax=Lentinula edodes TaxID=5353 RepID=A0A1Q3E741_LENED|nr:hypothetical protein LENED_004514 [Lentinula edodes]
MYSTIHTPFDITNLTFCLIERWPEPEDVWRRRRLPNGLGDYTHLSHLGWYITALAHQFVRNVCFRVCGCSGLS